MADIQQRINDIIKAKGLKKYDLANFMGIDKANVNVLLKTKDITKLERIAQFLQVDLCDLLQDADNGKRIYGFVEIGNRVLRIRTADDLLRAYNLTKDSGLHKEEL